MTAGELRKALEGVPDDYEVFVHVNYGYGHTEREEMLDMEKKDSDKEITIYS